MSDKPNQCTVYKTEKVYLQKLTIKSALIENRIISLNCLIYWFSGISRNLYHVGLFTQIITKIRKCSNFDLAPSQRKLALIKKMFRF